MIRPHNQASTVYMPDAETCWQAVSDKDSRFNGAFVFGVSSTMIYCRPSCPARLPRRDRVAFFAGPTEAERAGYRACLRCRPRLGAEVDPGAELVMRACHLIETISGDRLSLAELGASLGVSPFHLQRIFKKRTGMSPRQYALARRLERFKTSIKEGQSVTDSIYEAGYGSSSRLYEQAGAQLGMTPATYRRGGKGTMIAYTIIETRLGRLLVAATERGVCSVAFGDDDAKLVEDLTNEYPAAKIEIADGRLRSWVEALLAHLNGQRAELDLPLDVQATAFQLRVWDALRKIPYGETRSYAEIAEAIGRPTATRAVAQACASNPVALVNPCHRVVRADGAHGGYRWGENRKKALLAQEKANSTAVSPLQRGGGSSK
jgi:AraC family transcriptional regulator of adaptative response/methylated-DNA-[protein]-cysteine methyltransferase